MKHYITVCHMIVSVPEEQKIDDFAKKVGQYLIKRGLIKITRRDMQSYTGPAKEEFKTEIDINEEIGSMDREVVKKNKIRDSIS